MHLLWTAIMNVPTGCCQVHHPCETTESIATICIRDLHRHSCAMALRVDGQRHSESHLFVLGQQCEKDGRAAATRER